MLDFGVARAETDDLRATLHTTPGLVVGTLQTMSPEQAEASMDIDARTDVYSLGVLAYELLAGRPPIDLTDAPLHAALRRVLEEEPPRLGGLDRELRGDIEVVLAKALEKDRERRYASADAFAEDLRRIGRREPVLARPASTAYLLSKLARRHLGLTIGAALALMATITGLGAFVIQAGKTADAEHAAATEARISAAIGSYLLGDLLAAPDPRSSGRDVRVVEVLEKAAARAGARFAEDPELLARVRSTLGQTFVLLDRLELAVSNLRAALVTQRELYGPDDERTLETAGWLVEAFTARHDAPEGLRLGRASLERARAALGNDHRTTLRTATNLATNLMQVNEFAEAAALQREVIAQREEALGFDDTATILARENLAITLAALGKIDESLEMREDCLELRRARYGDGDPGTVIARCYLAGARLQLRRLINPAQTFEEILEQVEEVFGEEHQKTIDTIQYLAVALDQEHRFEESIGLHERVVVSRQRKFGPDHSQTIHAEMGLVRSLLASGLVEIAADLADDCVLRYSDAAHDPLQLGMLQVLAGEAQFAAGRPEPGCEHMRRSLETLDGITLPMAMDLARSARAGLVRYGDRARSR